MTRGSKGTYRRQRVFFPRRYQRQVWHAGPGALADTTLPNWESRYLGRGFVVLKYSSTLTGETPKDANHPTASADGSLLVARRGVVGPAAANPNPNTLRRTRSGATH